MEDLIKKLFNALKGLSDDDLKRLAELFKYQETSEAFIKMIESKLAFRNVSHLSKTRNINKEWGNYKINDFESRSNGEYHEHSQHTQRNLTSKKILWEGVESALSDRNLFPSTKDVVDILNSEFNCDIKYENFYKRGRRDLITYCLRRIKTMPDKEQNALLKSFFRKITKERSGLNQYKDLFRILTTYE